MLKRADNYFSNLVLVAVGTESGHFGSVAVEEANDFYEDNGIKYREYRALGDF